MIIQSDKKKFKEFDEPSKNVVGALGMNKNNINAHQNSILMQYVIDDVNEYCSYI